MPNLKTNSQKLKSVVFLVDLVQLHALVSAVMYRYLLLLMDLFVDCMQACTVDTVSL